MFNLVLDALSMRFTKLTSLGDFKFVSQNLYQIA